MNRAWSSDTLDYDRLRFCLKLPNVTAVTLDYMNMPTLTRSITSKLSAVQPSGEGTNTDQYARRNSIYPHRLRVS